MAEPQHNNKFTTAEFHSHKQLTRQLTTGDSKTV